MIPDTSQDIYEDLRKLAAEGVEAPREQWVEMIVGRLYSSHPYLSSFDARVSFNRVKAEDECATGAVVVTSPAGKLVYIPFIIESGELKPMDVMSDGSSYMFINEDRVDEYLNNPVVQFDVAKAQIKGLNDGYGGGPDQDNAVGYRSADEFLSKVSSKLHQEVLDERLDELFADICEPPKLSGDGPEKRALAIQVSRGIRDYDITVLFEDGEFEKSSALYPEVVSILGSAPEDRLTAPIEPSVGFDDPASEYEKKSSYFVGEFLTDVGPREGVLFDKVFSLSGGRLSPMMVGDGFYARGEFFAKEASANVTSGPMRGRGIFVFQTGALEPIEVRGAPFFDEDGCEKMAILDNVGMPGTLVLEDVILPVQVDRTVFAIPKDAAFIPVQEEMRAAVPTQWTSDTVLKCYGNSMRLDGRVKTAAVDESLMELLLVGLGRPATEAARLIKEAKTHGSCALPKLGEFTEPVRPKFIDVADGLLSDAVELAKHVSEEPYLGDISKVAEAASSGSIDTILGLQLADNIELRQESKALVSVIEEVQDKLCELLILSRLGALLRGKDGLILRIIKSMDTLLNGLRMLDVES